MEICDIDMNLFTGSNLFMDMQFSDYDIVSILKDTQPGALDQFLEPISAPKPQREGEEEKEKGEEKTFMDLNAPLDAKRHVQDVTWQNTDLVTFDRYYGSNSDYHSTYHYLEGAPIDLPSIDLENKEIQRRPPKRRLESDDEEPEEKRVISEIPEDLASVNTSGKETRE